MQISVQSVHSMIDPINSFPTPQPTPPITSARHHPYRRPDPLFLPSGPSQCQTQTQSQTQTQVPTHTQTQSQSQHREPTVPKTHMCRMRSSRGIRGQTYQEMAGHVPTMPSLAEELDQ